MPFKSISLGEYPSITLIHARRNNLFLATESGDILHFIVDPPIDPLDYKYHQTFRFSKPPANESSIKQIESTSKYLFTLQNSTVYQWRISDGTFLRNITKDQPKCENFVIFDGTMYTSHSNKFVYTWTLGDNKLVSSEYFDDGPIVFMRFMKRDSFIYITQNSIKRRNLQNNVTTIVHSNFDSSSNTYVMDGDIVYTTIGKKVVVFDIPKQFIGILSIFSSLFAVHDGFVFVPKTHVKDEHLQIHVFGKFGNNVLTLEFDTQSPIRTLYASTKKLFIITSDNHLLVQSIVVDEEDTFLYDDITASSKNVVSRHRNVNDCINPDLMTLEPFVDADDPDLLMIYLKNSSNTFTKAACFNKSELISYLTADKNSADGVTTLMSVYSRPYGTSNTGLGTRPTGQIVVKLPVNNMYVTFLSAKLMLNTKHVNTWYAVPLYGGKKRRIGNIKGIFGASMNHGQTPGQIVYKLFTYDQLNSFSGVTGKESYDEWPSFICAAARSLAKLVQTDEYFINALFHELMGF